jgi:hypothetical protein
MVASSTATRPAARENTAVTRAIAAELARRDPGGRRLAGLDPQHVASLAVDAILDPAAEWTERIGPFYDTEAVRALLGRGGRPVSRQAISKRRGLLALTTGSGRVVYPALQFRGRLPAPGLSRVLAALPESDVSRWTVAAWLAAPEPELDGGRPVDVLFDGGLSGIAAVVGAARHWAAALAA